jgi:two-component system, OmpR family, sensor histidine kinase CssS
MIMKYKKSIKKKIFLSNISATIICLLLTAVVFNICFGIYIRTQSKTQLVTAAQVLQKSLTTDLNLIKRKSKKDIEAAKLILKANKALRKTQLLLDINYVFIEDDLNMVYSIHNSDEESALTEEDILKLLHKINISKNPMKSRNFYFEISRKRYTALLYPLKTKDVKNAGYLFLYSDVNRGNSLMLSLNTILISILFITAAIVVIVSNILSRRIADPILLLSDYAKQIGMRKYDAKVYKYEDDEIGYLADTMKNMAGELYSYDNTIKTFLQNASHELRTPLMSIQGYAEAIKFGVIDNKEQAVEVILEESKRLSSLVENLLYLSKIEGLQENLALENINLEEFIMDCIDRVNGIAIKESKGIEFNYTDEIVYFQADEEKLSRALINVISNCLRYAEKYVRLSAQIMNGNILIFIKDDGAGFSEEDIDKVFERFYKGKGGNFGLGLTISKTIIEKHGGTINIENNEEGGACFKIMLPMDIKDSKI